jgi:hypothetical protein
MATLKITYFGDELCWYRLYVNNETWAINFFAFL